MWEIKWFKGCTTVGSEEKNMDGGKGGSYTHYFTAGYRQPVNGMRSEMIQ